MTIKGMNSLIRKLNALGGNSHDAVKRGVQEATKLVQGDAKDFYAPKDDGRLRNSIQGEVIETDEMITGRVSTNLEYAAYVEFGTGPVGDKSPKDLPPDILSKLHYRQDGWWIHESQIDADKAEKYKFFKIETDDGVFYYTRGQPAQPYLYPAIKQNEKRIKKVIADSVRKEIKKLGGG